MAMIELLSGLSPLGYSAVIVFIVLVKVRSCLDTTQKSTYINQIDLGHGHI